jgi:hypothetical protein
MTKIPFCVSEYPKEAAATIGRGRLLDFAMRTLTTPTVQRSLRSPRPSYSAYTPEAHEDKLKDIPCSES